MAKITTTNTTPRERYEGTPGAGTADLSAAPAPGEAIAAATPENTPVPGGGRWRWDIALPGWVEVPEPD